jgi:ribosome modulation factor
VSDHPEAHAFQEGHDAAVNGLHFKTDCPYTYDKFPGMSYAEFNSTKRHLMNEWFNGWKQYRGGSTRSLPSRPGEGE